MRRAASIELIGIIYSFLKTETNKAVLPDTGSSGTKQNTGIYL